MSEELDEWEQLLSHVRFALGKAGYDEDASAKWAIEGFVKRWNGLDLDAFVHALKEGQGDDIVLAIFAIGSTASHQSHDLLIPYLKSTQPMERWASALCLGKMREEKALPVLSSMLTECLPPEDQPGSLANGLWLYNHWRYEVILILIEWERPELAPIWLSALNIYLQVEQMIPEQMIPQKSFWRDYQNRVIYALGWLEEFETFTSFEVPDITLYSWKVNFILGYIHAHLQYPYIFGRGLWTKPDLKEQVARELQDTFGLSSEEQEICFAWYRKSTFS